MSVGYKAAALGLVALCIALLFWYRQRMMPSARWRGPFPGWVIPETPGKEWETMNSKSVSAAQVAIQTKAGDMPAVMIMDKNKGMNVPVWWGTGKLSSVQPVDPAVWSYWVLDPK